MTEPVLAWAREHLGAIEVTPIKDRPWARIWRLSSREGISFVKAPGVAGRYEAGLMAALYELSPARVAPVLALRPDTGWLLLADAGETLEVRLAGRFDVQVWVPMLARFAELQRLAEPLVTELIAAGVPDERPSRLPDVLTHLLQHSPGLSDLTGSERRCLIDRSRSWADADAELAGLGLRSSVQHGDLHPGNVSLGSDGLARFFDLGDASIAHPFTTLLVPLQLARLLGADREQVERLRDGYLEVFTDLATPSELRRGLDLALRSAALPRATAWDRALLQAPPEHPWGQPVLEYLRDLLEEPESV
jgi:hypothetical protein